MREAPAVPLIDAAARRRRDGAGVRSGGDGHGARASSGRRSTTPRTATRRSTGADALAIVTEWNEFREPDYGRMRKLMRTPVVFDGRNIYKPETVRAQGFTYYSMGRP